MSKLPPTIVKDGETDLTVGKRLREEARQLIADLQQKCAHIGWIIDSIHRQHRPDYHRKLQDAIFALHGCRTVHKASFAVRKVTDGSTIWEGTVEEFQLSGHPEAETCYAWSYQQAGRREYFSLLKSPLVNSPQRAVQLALAAPGWRLAKEAEENKAYHL